jgi:hypothetical protein
MKDRIALIRSRLARLDIKNISNEEIKSIILKYATSSDDNFTEDVKRAVVEELRKKYQPSDIVSPYADPASLEENALVSADTQGLGLAVPDDLSQQPKASQITITPQEAVDIIQAIAKDETSRNKSLAQQLLEQAHHKTDSLVALVAALPDIEAEMLKRKLQKMPRKQVNYEGVLDSYFRESTTFTHFVSDLAAEYGVTL